MTAYQPSQPLRQLCSLSLIVSLGKSSYRIDCGIWETVFIGFAELRWDYFHRIQKGQISTVHVTTKRACRSCDPSDVFGWVRNEVQTYQFPNGAPVVVPKENTIPVPHTNYKSEIEKPWPS